MEKRFLVHAVPQRPVLLLIVIVGHASHLTIDLNDLAHKNNVILFYCRL